MNILNFDRKSKSSRVENQVKSTWTDSRVNRVELSNITDLS